MESTGKILAGVVSLLLILLIMPFWGNLVSHICLAQKMMETQEVREVEVDIEPGYCPNPLDVESRRTIPVAILGTDNLDVTRIDPETVQLEGVSSVNYRKEDVSAPVIDRQDVCDCTINGEDGMDDLVFEFNIPEVASTIGELGNDDIAVLTITGTLLDGTPIEGEDCVVIRKTSAGSQD
ncbi:MAG: hypothetical protein AB1611_08535 [bacterium]